MIAELSPSKEDTEHHHSFKGQQKKKQLPNLKSIFNNSDLLLEEAETTEEDVESCAEDEDSGCDAIVRGICEMIDEDETLKGVEMV